MSMKRLKRNNRGGQLFALTVLLAVQGSKAQKVPAFSEASLQKACVTLQHTPLSMPELKILADVSRSTTNSPDLRSRAMAAYALALLMQGNTNAFSRAAHVQKAASPDLASLITIGAGDYTATCTGCLGAREKNTPCPLCMGSGKCKTCGGTGKAAAGAAGLTSRCPSCTRPGVCTKCNGKKNIEIACPTCNGTGKIFKLSESVLTNYRAILSGIEGICIENADYAERLKKAELEKDADEHIRLLQALTNSFPHRADLAKAQVLLCNAVAKREARLKNLQEQEARARFEREVAELRTLADKGNPESSITAIRTYLAEHPGSAARAELQLLLEGLVADQERKQLTRNILMGCGALTGILLLILILRPLLSRKKAATSGPLPGMNKIDKSDFTDPLTLTAQDSRSRVKKTTARTPSNDDQDVKP